MRRPADLTASNWTDPPHNRWGFWNVRELTKTARISRGNGPVTALPPHWVSLDDFIVLHEGDGQTLCRFGRSTGATCSEVNDLSLCSTVNGVEICRLVRMNDDEA